MKYLLLMTDGTIQEAESSLDVKDAQEVLGGDFVDLQPSVPPPFVMLADADGKQKGLNANWTATRLMRHNMKPDSFVVGTVIITGPPDAEGNLTDVTDEVREVIRQKGEA